MKTLKFLGFCFIILLNASNAQEICDDGIDNDNDGYADCFDSDCDCYSPFDCNSSTYYQTVGVNGSAILFETDIESFTLNELHNLSENGLQNNINAIGINPVDQFMYGITSAGQGTNSRLVRIDAEGRLTILGAIQGVEGSFSAGAFGPDGTYYICGQNKPLYSIDVNIGSARYLEARLTGMADPPFYDIADIAISPVDGYIYGIESRNQGVHPNRTLYRIDPSTGMATALGRTNIPGTGYLGAFYFTPSGTAIVYSNNTGTIYILDVTSSPPMATVVGTGGPTTSSNDGASNPFCLGLEKISVETLSKGDTLTYTIRLLNTSGSSIRGVWFRDQLKDELTAASNLFNITPGLRINNTLITGLSDLRIFIDEIAPGVQSFQFDVAIPCDYPLDYYSNQAIIEGYATNELRSDDPSSAKLQDSTRTILINKAYELVRLDTTICENSSIDFFGIEVGNEGTYTQFSSGCDTLFQWNVSTYAIDTNFAEVYICEGDSFSFHGRIINAEGLYVNRSVDSNGCDQIDYLELIVLSGQVRNEDTSICENEIINWRGQEIASPGLFWDTIELSDCFEVFSLQVGQRDLVNTKFQDTICPGDSIFFGSKYLRSAGEYKDTIYSTVSCDTINTIELSVYKLPEGPELQTECDPPIHALSFEDDRGWDISWDNGDMSDTTYYFRGGTIQYELISENGCKVQRSLELPALPDPSFLSILKDSSFAQGQLLEINLMADTSEWMFRWMPSDQFNCGNCPEVSYIINNSFRLELEAIHESGCQYSQYAFFQSIPPVDVYIPNIFTPNGDGINDLWTLYPSDANQLDLVKGSIYDRWGNLIREWKNVNDIRWDGTFKGEDCNEGVYVYHILLKDSFQRRYTKKGSITLVR